ncbi:uncharacterized protein LOC128291595 [Gossypium arboreum]|uniref:uncharacterized protein LOC128291595 n=1 Tax=Gossypium arboreum TaxID=29729 RepID=UPI0022F1B6A4|nr:uncharacterized protein LOC128291595 [Gossypium arboreum]
MVRLEFEREKAKMSQDLNALQEENYELKIDVQIERSKAEKVQKEVEVVRNDLRDLHLENKKLRVTIKNSGLGKSSAEWKEKLNNIRGGMEFWKGRAKKEEEKAARAMMELRKKNVEYEAVSAEVMTSRSKRQELKERIRDLEDMLQDRQQQLDTLLEALEEKNTIHVVQLSEEAEILICQFPPSRRSNISEFLARVKKYSDIARNCDTTSLESRHSYRTRRQVRVMEVKFNERIERMERIQRELQEQLAKSQQETRDLMARSREESLEQKDQMSRMMEIGSGKRKGTYEP